MESKEEDDTKRLAEEAPEVGESGRPLRVAHWEKQVAPSAAAAQTPSKKVDVATNRYPHCIVWSPLHPITVLFPFIGHMGITNSEGVIFDFAGSFAINKDDMAFGSPTRYLQLTPSRAQAKSWDQGVAQGCACYEQREHNLCCDNCHSHVARSLNAMKYGGSTGWNMIWLCFFVFFCAPFTSVGGLLRSWLPSAIVAGVLTAVIFAMKSL